MEKNLIILTGGKSKRMGTDKSLLKIGEMTFLEYLINNFSPYFEQIAISVNKHGKFEHLCLPNMEIVDIYNEIGPLGGIHAALKNTKADEIFVVSVDMPFASPQLALKVLSYDKDSDICVIKRADGKFEPLFAKYSKKCVPYIEEMIKNNNYKMQNLYAKVNTSYMECTDEELVSIINLNTIEDYNKHITNKSL